MARISFEEDVKYREQAFFIEQQEREASKPNLEIPLLTVVTDRNLDRTDQQGKAIQGDAVEGTLFNKGGLARQVWVAVSIEGMTTGGYEALQWPYIRPSIGIISMSPYQLPEIGKNARIGFWLAIKPTRSDKWFLAINESSWRGRSFILENGQSYNGMLQVAEGTTGERKLFAFSLAISDDGKPVVVLGSGQIA